jgi:putative N6-adenine-specific DNA methylase
MNTYVAKTMQGFENLLADELLALGATDIELLMRGVQFKGDKALLYKANLWCRTAVRILQPIATFSCINEMGLYNQIRTIDWAQYLGVDDTLAVDGTVHSEIFTHSHYVSLKVKDAICDQFVDTVGSRPNVNTVRPTLRINVRISGAEVTVSLDSSGDALHKRGYRAGAQHEAQMNEVLAAGLLLLAGWKGEGNFYDPFCGSGTLLIEAAMIAHNIPPNRLRYIFGFQTWKDYDEALWDKIRRESMRQMKPYKGRIEGSDISKKAVEQAQQTLEKAHLEEKIDVHILSFDEVPKRGGSGFMVTNPPYGERIDTDRPIEIFYKALGDIFKQRFTGYHIGVIGSNKAAMKFLGLKTTKKHIVKNGNIECCFWEYDLYEGTKHIRASRKNAENTEVENEEIIEKIGNVEIITPIENAEKAKTVAIVAENTEAEAAELADFLARFEQKQNME